MSDPVEDELQQLAVLYETDWSGPLVRNSKQELLEQGQIHS